MWISFSILPNPNAKPLEIQDYFTCHLFLPLVKTQDLVSTIWQTIGDAVRGSKLIVKRTTVHALMGIAVAIDASIASGRCIG